MSVHELQRLAEQKRIAEMQQQPMDVERRELVLMIRNLRRIIREFDEILLRNERNGVETSPEWSRQRQVCVERCNRYQLLLDSFDRPRFGLVLFVCWYYPLLM
ncbi:unnamed protein product [Anisakis simplex]|uniref:BAG domain-containing protein n=1 Tax=Anisakis simplex TaxID=6269 RepID=A0A0M3J3M2_ANISI|nr:unnamed protein product [Anisakis simplex]